MPLNFGICMKVSWMAAVSMALALFSGLGCSKSGRGGSSAKKDGKITGSPSDPPVTFTAQWNPSNRYVFRSEMSISSELPRQGRPKPEPQESTLGMDYVITVSNVASNGARRLVLEITSVQFEARMRDTPMISFDSLNKVVGTDGNIMAERLEKIVGSKITFSVSASNKISNVKGINEVMNTLTSGGNPRAEPLVRRLFTPQYLRHLIDLIVLPSDPVRIGQTWTGQVGVNPGPLTGSLDADVTYTFRGWQRHDDRKCAVIEFAGLVKSAGRSNPPKSAISSKIEKGEITGKSWFDSELGMVVESVSDQSVTTSGTIKWRRAATNSPPQSFTSQVRQHTSVKLTDVEAIKPPS